MVWCSMQKKLLKILKFKKMKKRFRISKNEPVKATLCVTGFNTGKLVASYYDSLYTRIKDIVRDLDSKSQMYRGMKGTYCVSQGEKIKIFEKIISKVN